MILLYLLVGWLIWLNGVFVGEGSDNAQTIAALAAGLGVATVIYYALVGVGLFS